MSTLYTAILTSSQKNVFGSHDIPFTLPKECLCDTGKTSTSSTHAGEHIYTVYTLLKPIKLSRRFNAAGRRFLSGEQKIVLDANSFIYELPAGHPSLDLLKSSHFNVRILEE